MALTRDIGSIKNAAFEIYKQIVLETDDETAAKNAAIKASQLVAWFDEEAANMDSAFRTPWTE